MKPTIAIIGLGRTGTGLATRLSQSPYRLLLFDTDVAKAQDLASQLNQEAILADIEALDCAREASWEADMIALAVPTSQVRAVAERIRQVAICKIVIDITTTPDDELVNALEEDDPLPQWLPHSKIVHVVPVRYLTGSNPALREKDVVLMGQHGASLETAAELMVDAGLAPVVVEDWSA